MSIHKSYSLSFQKGFFKKKKRYSTSLCLIVVPCVSEEKWVLVCLDQRPSTVTQQVYIIAKNHMISFLNILPPSDLCLFWYFSLLFCFVITICSSLQSYLGFKGYFKRGDLSENQDRFYSSLLLSLPPFVQLCCHYFKEIPLFLKLSSFL